MVRCWDRYVLRAVIGCLVVGFLVNGSFPREGWAVLLPSDFGNPLSLNDKEKLQVVLESKVVQQRLLDLGMKPQDVQEKISRLSDQEIHQFAQHTELLLPGGDAIGFLIGMMIAAIIVVVLLQLTGHRVLITR